MSQFKQARIDRGWSQKQLAYYSGVSIEMIRKLEHGRTNPRVSSLEKIAQALGFRLVLGLAR
ncbi:MAG: XRE family transcriptional regulator [Chroococcales cyanobacterium metabat2.561]|nr:MAG: XRE family transcriptional regulator [Chroococcales cyanobacterium metabat2.561]